MASISKQENKLQKYKLLLGAAADMLYAIRLTMKKGEHKEGGCHCDIKRLECKINSTLKE